MTVVEGQRTTLTCITDADPHAAMTYKKVGNAANFITGGENVSLLHFIEFTV